MLGLFTANAPEARRRSAELLEANIAHDLFGPQSIEFEEYYDRPRGQGRFFAVNCVDRHGDVSPEFIGMLVQEEISEVANAGTFNSIIYALPTQPDFGINALRRQFGSTNFPSRHEILFLEDSLILARVNGAPIERRSLHDLLRKNVGPAAGFHEPPGSFGIEPGYIEKAVAETRQALAAFIEREKVGPRRGIERVALSVSYSAGAPGIPEPSTDNCLHSFRDSSRDGSPRLLMKLSHSRQSPLDPSAIGPDTILRAKECLFDGIVLSTDGLIFDRAETLRIAGDKEMPIYGVAMGK